MKTISLPATAIILLCVASCKTSTQSPPPRPVGVTDVHPRADPRTRSIAEREVARREQAVRDASELLEDGKRKYADGDGDLEAAVQTFKRSIDTYP